MAGRAGVQDFGDAEVEQLRRAVLGHQDVVRFQVTMDDKIAMGVLDRCTDGHEEPQPRMDRQSSIVAVVVQGLALDVLHDQIGQAVLGRAAVEQPGDVRVLQVGEDLPLAAQATRSGGIQGALTHQLDGNLFVELLVGALGEKDRAHAAVPDRPEQAIGTEVLAAGKWGGVHQDDSPGRCADGTRKRCGQPTWRWLDHPGCGTLQQVRAAGTDLL